MCDDFGDGADLLRRAAQGDQEAQRQLFGQYRSRLKKMVRLRLSRRLWGHVDESDIVDDALLEASRHLPEYVASRQPPLILWLRRIVAEKLLETHRQRLGSRSADAQREIYLHRGAMPTTDAGALAARLLGRLTSPLQAAAKAEMRIQLQEALNSLDPLDREILALRHFEQLSIVEAAQELGLEPQAASNRYVRGLARLQKVFEIVFPND